MEFLHQEGFKDKGFRLTSNQLNFLAEGSYEFMSRSGKKFYRDLQVIAQHINSGYAVVQESYCDEYEYQRNFLLSPEGKQEKIKSLA